MSQLTGTNGRMLDHFDSLLDASASKLTVAAQSVDASTFCRQSFTKSALAERSAPAVNSRGRTEMPLGPLSL